MRIIRRFMCLFGMHKRDGNRVAKRGSLYHAPCQYCDKPMHRLVDGGPWQAM